MKRSYLVILLAIPVLIAYLQKPSSSTQNPVEAPPFPVGTLKVEPVSHYEVHRDYAGEVVAGRQTDLSFQRSGEIRSVLVQDGQQVRQGQLLATLDTRQLDARRQELQASLARSRARLAELKAGPRKERIEGAKARMARVQSRLELGRLKLQRRQDLFNEGALAREGVDEAEQRVLQDQADLEDARQQLLELERGTRVQQLDQQFASVREAEARLASLQVQVQDSSLVAPYDGIISERLLDEGAAVGPGVKVFEIYELSSLEARVPIPVDFTDYSELQLTLEGEVIPARALGKLPRVDANSNTVVARFEVKQLRPGRAVVANLKRKVSTQGFWLPNSALLSRGRGLFHCYAVSDSGTVVAHQVELLHSESQRSLVRGTLSPGDQVIVEGVAQVVVGQKVEPKA